MSTPPSFLKSMHEEARKQSLIRKGFTIWPGGECPVAQGARVDVVYRNGSERHNLPAGPGAASWGCNGSAWDIIAYRLREPAMHKRPLAGIDKQSLVQKGYTLWSGGRCPLASDTFVDVVYRDGQAINGLAVGRTPVQGRNANRWYHYDRESDDDIIAYRLCKPPVETVCLKGDISMFYGAGPEFTRAYRVKASGDVVYGTEDNTGDFDTENYVDLIGHCVPKDSYDAVQPKIDDYHFSLVNKGVKHDSGKPRFSLLPLKQIETVVAVLEFGARKYAPGNWQKVENPRDRYFDAAMRHVFAWRNGEKLDPETQLPHLAHAVCCLLFLMWGDDQK